MIVYPAEYNRRKESLFTSIAEAAGGGRRLRMIGLSFRAFPESRARTAEALARAKRQPKGRLGRGAKWLLIWAQYNWSRRYFLRHPGDVALAWNGLTGSRRAFMAGARDAGAARLFAELAPLPGRVTLDPEGVNSENALPRDPAFYRLWAASDARRCGDGWRALGATMTARKSRRADVGQAGDEALAGAAPFLFVPLQVPDDSQITLFSGWTGGLEGFLAALASASSALPAGWQIRVKEHPSAKTSLARAVTAAMAASGWRIVADNATDTFAQVAASRGVITINSSVGLQAFFHDKPVLVAGQAFFAIPGIATPVTSADDLHAALGSAETLEFDADLRDAFMNYLDHCYYPRTDDVAGLPRVDAQAVRDKLAEARAAATPPLRVGR